MNKIIKYWKTLAWSVFMLVVFLLPADNLSKDPLIPWLDKAIHMIMFAVFTWFLVWDRVGIRSLKRPAFRNYITALILAFLFGSSIELLQEASRLGRSAELSDVIYDIAGSLVSVGIMAILYRTRKISFPKA